MPSKPSRRREAIADATDSESEGGNPKTTRPPASERREPQPVETAARRLGRRLDAVPDRIDIRDWFYQPTLRPLPDRLVNVHRVPFVLDQGTEGACTGFALAAVINYQLAVRGLLSAFRAERGVSPRMLYEMARRYDEWPGERYDGSSARGAMKGWISHGVARRSLWPDRRRGGPGLTDEIARDAQLTPGGAYFRVMHRNLRDVHAALAEVGVVYATLMVHRGWDTPGPAMVRVDHTVDGTDLGVSLPMIRREGRADGGHAVALVGYTREGFVVQNSWGESWGARGFALLPYEDWMLHATDCWVAQLGVPVDVGAWSLQELADTSAGRFRASDAIPLADIRPHVIDIGNNGRLSRTGRYWTSPADLDAILESADRAAGDGGWERRRLALYLHGGLGDEAATAKRVVAYRDVLLANRVYPVHVMWETGFAETLRSSVLDLFTNDDERAAADWLRRLRDGLTEAKDRTIELTAALPGSALWREMKENARLASARDGGMSLFADRLARRLAGLPAAERGRWELHLVAHSAGAIFATHALAPLLASGIALRSVQLLAPALRIDLFKAKLLPLIRDGRCPLPTLYVLSDTGERDDELGPYGKSLLYLVSNAFEDERETPLLGMQRFLSRASEDPDESLVDPQVEALFAGRVDGRPSLVVAGAAPAGTADWGDVSTCDTHGGFDNDRATMNSVLARMLGSQPVRPFGLRDLQFE